MINIVKDIIMTILGYLKADWYILLIGILMAVSVNVYVDSNKLKSYLEKNSKLSIPGSVAFGALTPLCACGTMAVILSMFVSSLPWGPVMAFLISSPLTSPSEYIFETAFFGNRFANVVLISSVLLGISAGFVAHILETKTNFFNNQFRFLKEHEESCCSMEHYNSHQETTCCSVENTTNNNKIEFIKKYKLDIFIKEFIDIGIKKVLFYFIIFIAIGRIIELLIHKEMVMGLFSDDKSYSILLGATVGLPLYVSGPSALPILKSFINSGAGEGAVLAFLITGKATGMPVIAGLSTLLKKRAIFFYVAFIYIGGILAGYIYKFIISIGL